MALKQPRGEATVARILDAALEVYARHGHTGFTVHAIAAASATSLGSIYHHFGSVDGLAAALYARCMARLLDALITALEGRRTARGGLTAVVRAYLAFTRQHRAAAGFLHSSPHAGLLPAHAAAIAGEKAPRIEQMQAWYQRHAQAGSLVELPAPIVEMLVIGPVAETARRWLAGVPGIDLDEAARLLPERIWRSLRRPRPRTPPR